VGRLVEVTHRDGTDTGRLVEVGTDRLVLDVPATKKTPARRVTLDLDAVQRGVVQVEFSRPGADDHDTNDERADDTPATEGDS